MTDQQSSRRLFLVTSGELVGAAWLASQLPRLDVVHDGVRAVTLPGAQEPFAFFTPREAADVEDLSAVIIPTDKTPGAREAHVVRFMDRLLASDFALDSTRAWVREALGEFQTRVTAAYPEAGAFTELSPEQQEQMWESLWDPPSQFPWRMLIWTWWGYLADPSYGGNYQRVGWKTIGFEGLSSYQPPFGYYDRDYESSK